MASFEEINTLVIACCVIHNICIDSDDTIEDVDAFDIDPNHFEGIYANAADGNAKRDQLVDLLVQADD